MDKYPIAASSLERYYHVDGKELERQYKDFLSGYGRWLASEEGEHADRWLVRPENIGQSLSIDETALSNGELYTIVSNKDAHGRKGTLVAIVSGTKAEDVYTALWNIPAAVRETVREITLDLSSSMSKIARKAFPMATRVIDRFHVQKLAIEALQQMRVDFRWDAIHDENKETALRKSKGLPYEPSTYANGDSRKQLLARSRYLLDKWSESQRNRAEILFGFYPDIESAYNLTDELRRIYSFTKIKGIALTKLAHWYRHIEEAGYDSFMILRETVQVNYKEIVNFFENRSTNASAESFNAKIKAFKAQLRSVSDVKYFLFRLQTIFA